MQTRFNASLWLCLGAAMVEAFVAQGGEVIASRVDQLIASKFAQHPAAAPADDAEFLRRVYLDFDGGIPSAAEARTFLADASPDKRAQLIDRLLAAPRFSERMAEAFHIILMERRGEDANWRAFLLESFKSNKPWDVLAREILSPDFHDEKQRGAGYFITKRLEKVGEQVTDYPGLTRDVGRMFLGVDLQCCQCHKHLTVKDYKQIDFNGLFVAYQNAKLQSAEGGYKTPWVSESPLTNQYEFVSVLSKVKSQTGPRVPFGEEVAIPEFSSEELWLENPKRNVIGTPKFSPLKEIAQRIADKENPWFARNIANRVWFLLMGRGLVEPLDFHHSANPPSHPELLDLLAEELTSHQFDLKWLIRELALTQTYQRSSRIPADAKDLPEDLFLVTKERHLAFEQIVRTFLQATGEFERVSAGQATDLPAGEKSYKRSEFETAFRAALANAATEPELEVSPSLRAALFFRNSDYVHWAVKPRAGNLVDRLAKLEDTAQLAEEIYLSIVTRLPTSEEKIEVARWLEKHGDNRAKAIGHYAWALLSSTEFFVNH